MRAHGSQTETASQPFLGISQFGTPNVIPLTQIEMTVYFPVYSITCTSDGARRCPSDHARRRYDGAGKTRPSLGRCFPEATLAILGGGCSRNSRSSSDPSLLSGDARFFSSGWHVLLALRFS